MICNFICTFAQKNRTLHYIAYTSKTGNKVQHSSVYKRVIRNRTPKRGDDKMKEENIRPDHLMREKLDSTLKMSSS